MALGNIVDFGVGGLLSAIDGPSSVASSNGLGQRNPVGRRVRDDNGNEYVYLAGVASVAAGDWCFFNSATAQLGTVARLPAGTATNGLLCVACAAIIASCWGWFQLYGLTPSFTAIATDAAADGKSLSANSGTIGRVGTGPVATKNIFNAVAVGASAANVGTAFINYPYEFGSSTI